LSQQGYTIADVDVALVARYLHGLPPPPVGRRSKAAAGLPHLLTLWQQQGLLPSAAPLQPQTATDDWLGRYMQYLEQVCGAAANTRTRYRRVIQRLLTTCFATRPLVWSTLQAQDLTTFLRHEAATTSGAGRKMPSVAVRSFLRFLVFCGELPPGFEAAVPIPRQWTHAPLPQRLTTEEVERVLTACLGESPKALRNHAILMLLARLGLRAQEVASLGLEDLDWHAGRVHIRPGKTHHARVLPLLQEVGRAVAAYLHDGRPATTSRLLFLHCRAPFAPFADPTVIGQIARRACLRAGIPARPRLSAHTFRHYFVYQVQLRWSSSAVAHRTRHNQRLLRNANSSSSGR
jgi:integrase